MLISQLSCVADLVCNCGNVSATILLVLGSFARGINMQAESFHTVLNKAPEGVCSGQGWSESNQEKEMKQRNDG